MIVAYVVGIFAQAEVDIRLWGQHFREGLFRAAAIRWGASVFTHYLNQNP